MKVTSDFESEILDSFFESRFSDLFFESADSNILDSFSDSKDESEMSQKRVGNKSNKME